MSAPKSKVRSHLPVPDPSVPADQAGHRYCRDCGLAVVDGDPRHTLPNAPAWDVQMRRAGEDGDER